MISINKNAVEAFKTRWAGRGNEDSDTQSFWTDFLHDICGVDRPNDIIKRENHVELNKKHRGSIDIYIPLTRVLIEQKSLDVDLNKPILQSDGTYLTPFEQAKRYSDQGLGVDDKARWIITCNFREFYIYDMREPHPKPEIIQLENLKTEYNKFEFLVDANAHAPKEIRELAISVKAGELVKMLYDAVKPRYIKPDSPEALRSLNIFCVRIVFLLYAEDSGLFNKAAFHDYLKANSHDVRQALLNLFKILAQHESERDVYLSDELKVFPYVNGGLFEDIQIEIPKLNTPDDTPVKIILEDMSNGFDWSNISPTIFGAVFESTLNPETRSSNGMHYTSIENIHRVIEPLFLEDLKSEFDAIVNQPLNAKRNKDLAKFQDKLAGLKFLDPACGSGNFLTETYLSLRRLENKLLKELDKAGQIKMIFSEDESPVKVSINQFYGIEINDFAVSVAKTALWIAEHQMMKETRDILHDFSSYFLPLKTYANIVEANALKIDWREVIKPKELNYIMGNPPFRGYSLQTQEQKEEILKVYSDESGTPYKSAGKIDYVAAWYFKAAEFMQETNIKAAFVSTNSITQGEQVSAVWKPLFNRFGIHINFAWRTFKWNSESADMAQVHVVIIGFSNVSGSAKIYDGENIYDAKNINPYLIDAENIFIDARSTPLCNVPAMISGGKPAEGGNLILTEQERGELLQHEPQAQKFIRPFMMGKDFIDRKPRYCLWLVDIKPEELNKMPRVFERVKAVKDFRLASKKQATQRKAETPALFDERVESPTDYIAVPVVSSGERKYIPIGWLDKSVIPGNKLFIIPNATLYHFGVLTSRIHMDWMRLVASRYGPSYQYSNTIVYNNFPWPSPSDKQRVKIEQTAQKILDARALYPESSFANLYDDVTMPVELRKAHKLNDIAVCEAYGFDKDISEADIVSNLMRMYQELTLK